MTASAVAGKPAQSLAWDAEGELASVGEGGGDTSEYTYTADGDRLVRKQDGRTTVYLPGGQEVTVDDETSVVTAQRYYMFNGETVAVRTSSGASGTTTIVADHHGTGQVQVAQATNTVHRRYMDPYGGQRGAVPTWTGDHGFLDKPVDATGLVQVGARYYDPGLGKFISPDPVMDVTDPQQWAPYSYANSNPVTSSDPSGLWLGGLVDKVKKAASKTFSALKRTTKRAVAAVVTVARKVTSVIRQSVKYVARAVVSATRRVYTSVKSTVSTAATVLRRGFASSKAWVAEKAKQAQVAAEKAAAWAEKQRQAVLKKAALVADAATAAWNAAAPVIASVGKTALEVATAPARAAISAGTAAWDWFKEDPWTNAATIMGMASTVIAVAALFTPIGPVVAIAGLALGAASAGMTCAEGITGSCIVGAAGALTGMAGAAAAIRGAGSALRMAKPASGAVRRLAAGAPPMSVPDGVATAMDIQGGMLALASAPGSFGAYKGSSWRRVNAVKCSRQRCGVRLSGSITWSKVALRELGRTPC